MTTRKFTDLSVIAGVQRRASDGALIADARIARTGIQTYLGSEVGRDDLATVRVYRPGSEVFSADTMKSAAHRPVTNDHPAELVSTDNWKQVAVGQTGDEIKGEGIFIRVPLMVSDGDTIKQIEAGKRELSAGYTCDLDFSSGVTENGEQYDAVQRNIRINHVAIVRAGRAGSQVRIGDAAQQWGASPVNDDQPEGTRSMTDKLRTMMVDGLSVEVTDQTAQIIQKALDGMAAKLTDSAAQITTLQKELATKDADHSKALAAKDAEIDSLKGKVLSDADLDKRVAARAHLVTVAKDLAKDVKTDGLSDAAIRKAVVIAKLGDAVKDKDQVYIDARFDILVEDAAKARGSDPLRDAISGLPTATTDAKVVSDAYAEMVKDLKSGTIKAAA